MDKPLLLLDVDGVLLPFGEIGSSAWYYRTDDHPVHRIASPIRARLDQLLERFDVHWCTGWEHEANAVLGRLNELPALPVVPLVRLTLRDPHWKLGAIINYVEDRPFAFIDDDIGPEAIAWAEKRNETIPTLFVPTRCAVGMEDKSVEALMEWADSLTYSGSSV